MFQSEQQLRACIPSGSISHGTSESLALLCCSVQGLVSSRRCLLRAWEPSGSQSLWVETEQPLPREGEHRDRVAQRQVEVWLLHLLAV